jgi:hypothetical protein
MAASELAILTHVVDAYEQRLRYSDTHTHTHTHTHAHKQTTRINTHITHNTHIHANTFTAHREPYV